LPRGPEVSTKRNSEVETSELISNINLIISLRTVAALRKQSCGLFLAAPQRLCLEDPKSAQKNSEVETSELISNINLIISLRTVTALRKQSCGLFLAVPQELCSEDPKSAQKETPKSKLRS